LSSYSSRLLLLLGNLEIWKFPNLRNLGFSKITQFGNLEISQFTQFGILEITQITAHNTVIPTRLSHHIPYDARKKSKQSGKLVYSLRASAYRM
jgi:hypothetical protein